MAEHFLPVVLVEIGVLSNLGPHLLGIQFVLFAKGPNIDAAGGNAMFGEEALGTLRSSFSEDIIVFIRSTIVGVAAEDQMCFRSEREI
jgi:hypothetical protein